MELPFDIKQIIESLKFHPGDFKLNNPNFDPSQPGNNFVGSPDHDFAGSRTYYDFFDEFANGSDNSVSNWLLEMSDHPDENIRNGWYNNIFNWLQTLSQRTYEQERLADERSYNTPEAILQRLMQTGLSRQAALALLGQMHGGSGSGIGVSSPIPGSASPLSETQSQKVANYAGAANSLASALASLGQFGINATTAHATNSLNSALAQSQQMSSTAQIQSAELNGLIYDAESKGLLSTKGKTFDDVVTDLRGVTADQSPKIHSFMNDGKMSALMSTPGSYRIASDNYNTRFNNNNSLQSSLQSALQSQLQQTNLDAAILDYDYSKLQFEDYGIRRDLVNQYTMLDYKLKCQMLIAESDPKVIANYKEQLKNDSAFNACNSALRLRLRDTLENGYESNPSMREAMNLCYYLDYIGFSGEVGAAVKGIVNADVLGPKLNDAINGFGQFEQSNPLTSTLKLGYDLGGVVKRNFLDASKTWWLPNNQLINNHGAGGRW